MATTKREATELIDETLRLVGLTYEEFAGKYPSEFSGGQLQHVSVARALLTKPNLLIAGELVSMVDASLRMSIVNRFRRLKEETDLGVLYRKCFLEAPPNVTVGNALVKCYLYT